MSVKREDRRPRDQSKSSAHAANDDARPLNVVPDYSHLSGAHFLRIAQSLPAAIYTTDADGLITFYNEAAAELWGRRPNLGEDWWCGSWRLYWSDGTPMAHHECPMAMTLKTGKAALGYEAIAERPDGTRFPFIPYPTPLFEDGKLVGALNMLVDISEIKRSEENGQRLAAIVQSSDDAIMTKSLDGVITSWNKGAERIFGYTENEIVGKPGAILIPLGLDDGEGSILARIGRGERIDHYETVRQRKDGQLLDVSLTVSPLRNSEGKIVGASKVARNITDAKQAGRMLLHQTKRLETLNQIAKTISQDLDLERTVQTVTDVATELAGAKFGAFFYNLINESGESYMLYTLSGAPRSAFENFGMPRNTAIFDPTFRGSEVVRSDDIRTDPRYGKSAPHHGMPKGHLPVVSYLAAPVVGRNGEVIGGLFFAHDQPGIFTQESEDVIVGFAAHAAIAIDNARLYRAMQDEVVRRQRAEDSKQLLLNEIQHRVKNTLTTVQAIAGQTFRGASGAERQAFSARLLALSRAHDLLTTQNWDRVSVGEVVERAVAPFRERNNDRFVTSGPDTSVSGNAALALAMVLHELGTNAVKYGALSNEIGRVTITWRRHESDAGPLNFHWRESDGPAVQPPQQRGFGSTLIERVLENTGSTELKFARDGVECILEIDVGAVHPADAQRAQIVPRG